MVRTLWKLLAVAAVGIAVWSSGASAQISNDKRFGGGMLPGNKYLCRKVKDLRMPQKFVPVFGITTLDVVGADTCDLKKVLLLCNPVSQDGGPIDDPTLQYCCYKSRCTQKPVANFFTSDQFGLLTLQTKKPFLYCTPCALIPAPP